MADMWILVLVLNGIVVGEGPYFREKCLTEMLTHPIEEKPTCIKASDAKRTLRQVPFMLPPKRP